MSNSNVNVLYQFNQKYAPFAGVSITSLFENNKEDKITVWLLGEDLSEDSVKKFDQIAKRYNQKIIIKEMSHIVENMKEWGIPPYRGSYAANLRLFLPYILNKSVKRVLYLDADTVVNQSIHEFYELPLETKTVAMVLDSFGNPYKIKNLGFDKQDFYFNSGVILYDLNKWREKRYSEKIIEHVKAGNIYYSSPDQDLINIICKNDILKVSPRYNFQPVHRVYDNKLYYRCFGQVAYYSSEELEAAKKNVVIYHFFRFIGEFPWNRKTVHPYKKIFNHYLRLSPWKEYVKQPADKNAFMKIEKILYICMPRGIFLRIFAMFHCMYLSRKPEIKKAKE